VAAVEEECVLTLMNVGRKWMVAQEAGRGYLVAEMSLRVGSKTGAWIQQAVLVDELGIEVLTWAGKDNPDAQTYED
jgi:hypothetical protein